MAEILIGLVCFFAAVTVIGHGIWVLLAAIFGRSGDSSHSRANGRCPECFEILTRSKRGCTRCGWPNQVVVTNDGFETIERGLKQLIEQGRVEPEATTAVFHWMKDQRAGGSIKVDEVPIAASVVTAPPADEAVGRAAPAMPRKSPERPPILPPSAPLHTTPASPVIPPVSTPDADVSMAHSVDVPSPPVAPESRIEKTLERMAARAAVEPPDDTPPPVARERRRRDEHWLAAFMDEKNIRWGELVGGLLIVCCAVALVVSFWSAIAERPLLKFCVFNGVTAAVLGAGYYTGTRWKLPTTSQGLLIIGTLLVPLNFLAIAAFTAGEAPTTLLPLLGEAASIGIFAMLVYWAGRALTPRWPWALTVGVVASAASQLLVRRFVAAGVETWPLVGTCLVPCLAYVGSTGWMLRSAHRISDYDEPETAAVFKLLGLCAFSVAMPLALAAWLSGAPLAALHRLAPLVSLVGWPLLASGLLLWQRVTDRKLSGLRTAGTAVAVFGAGVLFAALWLAWPTPSIVAAMALLNFAILSVVAVWYALPAAHLAAVASLAAGWFIASPAVLGRVDWNESDPALIASQLLSAVSGTALAPLVVLLSAVCVGLMRRGAREVVRWYAVAVAGVMLASTVLASWYGFGRSGDPAGVTWVYLLYGVLTLIAAAPLRAVPLAAVGSVYIVLAIVQGLVYGLEGRAPLEYPWLVAMLMAASVQALGMAVLEFRRRWQLIYGPSLAALATITSLASLAMSLNLLRFVPPHIVVGYVYWLAAIVLVLAWSTVDAGVFAVFQALLAGAVMLSVASWLERFDWYDTTLRTWFDPRTIEAQGIALATLGLMWSGLRLAATRLPMAKRSIGERITTLVNPPWPACDRIIAGIVTTGLVGLAAYAVLPGISQEWSCITNSAAATSVPAIERFEVARLPHRPAFGWAAWLLWALVLGQQVLNLRSRAIAYRVLTLIVVLVLPCLLLAGRFEANIAAASALRWLLAAWLLTATWLLCFGELWMPAVRRFGIAFHTGWLRLARPLVLALAAGPILLDALRSMVLSAAGQVAFAPVTPSWFAALGSPASHALPLLAVMASLAALGLRERRTSLIFGGGVTFTLATVVAYCLYVATAGTMFPSSEFLRVAQIIAISGSLVAIAWMILAQRLKVSRAADPWLTAQVTYATVAADAPIVVATCHLLFEPVVSGGERLVADLVGWSALALAIVVRWQWTRWHEARWSCGAMSRALLGVGTLAAIVLDAANPGSWLTFHLLILVWIAMPWLVGVWARITSRTTGELPTRQIWSDWAWWAKMSAAMTVVFGIRAFVDDPQGPWWTVGSWTAVAGLGIALAMFSGASRFLTISALLINAAASLVWLKLLRITWNFLELAEWNIVVAGLMTPLWAYLELFRMPNRDRPSCGRFTLHAAVATLALAALGMITLLLWMPHRAGILYESRDWVIWSAVASTAIAIAACLWNAKQNWTIGGLYGLGLIAVAVMLDRLRMPSDLLPSLSAAVVSAYGLATSYLWSRRDGLRAVADRLRIPTRHNTAFDDLTWLVPANLMLTMLVGGLGMYGVWTHPAFGIRVLAANALLIQGVAVALLARGERRSALQTISLLVGVAGAMAWGWMWIDPASTAATLVNRFVVMTAALAVMASLYGLAVVRLPARFGEWVSAARRLSPPLLLACSLATLVTLGVETRDTMHGGTLVIQPWAILVVTLTLVGQFAWCLAAALLPGRDPLGMTERGRTVYVYAAEAILALEFWHVRMSMPWLFTGFFAQYWPMIVMLLAFLGIGISEVFRRQRRLVLADPLQNTGALLPMLPVLGFWMMPSHTHFSLVLLVAGGLYATLAVMRRSFGFGLLATLLANGSLWYLLGRADGFGFLEHPQLWLIPPSLCVLVAAWLNRDRLSDEQQTTIRYLASTTIYVSSTADIFLRGVANQPLLPLWLAGLSIVGVLAGIALRVRAFLFLGTAFLIVSLFTVIWYAAVDLEQTWIWSVTGIATGVLIIAVFAVFEKKRQDVLRLVERLNEWDA